MSGYQKRLETEILVMLPLLQGLLGVAKKRMDSAMEQANSCFSKQKLLESTRKRILDGYSKQIASKKNRNNYY